MIQILRKPKRDSLETIFNFCKINFYIFINFCVINYYIFKFYILNFWYVIMHLYYDNDKQPQSGHNVGVMTDRVAG